MNTLNWLYNKTVKKHFFHPQGILGEKEIIQDQAASGLGQVGSPACGDMMKMWIWVDPKKDRIIKMRWQTFGCASAIASTSMLYEMLMRKKSGTTITEALKITPVEIMQKLGGLPKEKIHCSVLGDQVLQAAIFDYFRKSQQTARIPAWAQKTQSQKRKKCLVKPK